MPCLQMGQGIRGQAWAKQTCLKSLIHPSLWRTLHLNAISADTHTPSTSLQSQKMPYLRAMCSSTFTSHLSASNTDSFLCRDTPASCCRSPSLSSGLLQVPEFSPCSVLVTQRLCITPICPWTYRGIGNASDMSTAGPRCFGVPPRMSHNCPFLPKGLCNSEHQFQLFCAFMMRKQREREREISQQSE